MLRVIHCFGQYLKTTENWSYRLVAEMEGTEPYIVSRRFLPTNYYHPRFHYVLAPFRKIDWNGGKKPLLVRFLNAIVVIFRSLYPALAARLLREEGIDIVHSHFAKTGWRFRKLAKRLEVPHVVSFYGWDYERLPHQDPKWKRKYKRMFREIDLFVCEGSHGKRILEQMGCPAEKVVVNRLGVVIHDVPFIERNKQPGRLRLVQIAGARRKKGQIDALVAFHLALDRTAGMTLDFYGVSGTSEVGRELEEYIRQHRLEEKVRLLPGIAFEHLYATLREYDLFLHPSRYDDDRDCEGGAPVVILDAQATGMPIVATTHCDIPDEVADGITGLLAPEGDTEQLARQLVRFCEMGQEEYDRFARAARRHVEENYDASRNAGSLKRIYDGLVSARAADQAVHRA